MNELRNGCPSMVPLTFTSPRVPKYSADPGHTTYVQPPGLGLFCRSAVNSSSIVCLLSVSSDAISLVRRDLALHDLDQPRQRNSSQAGELPDIQ
jgi:hypothetical protein